jgi:hypothetical protein
MLPTESWIDWISDPESDNDEYIEPFLDEGFDSQTEENDDDD